MATKLGVIDDSRTVLEWFRHKLTPLGFDVGVHDNPIGTQAFISGFKPDLLLLDVQMPGLDGDVLCKMIRNNPTTRDTMIILYSKLDEGKLKDLAAECSADGYLPKTNNAAELAHKIKQLLIARAKTG
jgi:DNA-binding response OmpR family regulator